jgi:hypothetical protein
MIHYLSIQLTKRRHQHLHIPETLLASEINPAISRVQSMLSNMESNVLPSLTLVMDSLKIGRRPGEPVFCQIYSVFSGVPRLAPLAFCQLACGVDGNIVNTRDWDFDLSFALCFHLFFEFNNTLNCLIYPHGH